MNPSADVLPGSVDAPVVPAPPRSRRTRRIPLRDRAWMPFHTVRSAGPVRPPSADRIRRLLIKLSEIDPSHPLLCRLDERSGRLHPVAAEDLDGYLSAVISVVPDVDAVELARRMQAMPLHDLPFMIAISERSAAMRSAHAIGDTSTANPWFFGLLKAEDPDHALELIMGQRSSAYPLASAMANQFGRHPGRAIRAVRRALPLGPSTFTAPAGSRRQQSPAAAVAGTAELVTATASTEVERVVRQWRSQNAPKASMAAVWMSASIRALRNNGIDPGAGVFTMMNCRRYLPDHAAVSGNFAVGPYLTPADLGDPASLGAELADAAADGVPLLLLSALTARSILRRGRPARMPSTTEPGSPPKINLSYFGSISSEDIAWAETDHDHHAQYVVAAEPAGPQAITYVLARSPYGMHLSATAHPEFVDVGALGAALDRVARDPIGLLS